MQPKTIALILLIAAIGIIAIIALLTNNDFRYEKKIKTSYVDIKGSSYLPEIIEINAGERVVWANRDSLIHTVTFDTGSEQSSSNLGLNEEYGHIFNIQGTFDYHCENHPSMKGKIIVK
ncbi:cupredoxin domain-containing protein [Candidatus Pacearchaeota archaeon]|nr:cupredoxin domain-containing protein [Candidatus Pacearchaeota archaeon]